eukprot:TRINITY_DN1723_c0_g1_i1.p1 TRINITY_DN1723_c0_g1~~TRINITY_DN1723_c0_g1_i1.p1  ORF type:complete len:339 (-),score=100.13 TRINITY_DN1723_c0_g1_i1:23-1039(-)
MVKVAVFGTKKYVKEYFTKYNDEHDKYELNYLETTLTPQTAALAQGHEVVCVFVNDDVSGAVIDKLAEAGVKLIALRCSGFNSVDTKKAEEKKIGVYRVPAYSPYAVAEHAVALISTLNRKTHKAYNKVREGNFAIDGLMGFDIHGKTVGVVGTGAIGQIFAKIMKLGFGAEVIAYDVMQDKSLPEMGINYVPLDELLGKSDIISLHVPLLDSTKHMINEDSISKMKKGVMLVNTSRGPLIDTKAVIRGLKSKQIGALGLDVYEEEDSFVYEDNSDQGIDDELLARLMSFHNVLITGHQAFFTHEAMTKITETTFDNIAKNLAGKPNEENKVPPPKKK